MASRFDYFILLADMRTGSNFLESNLNALEGVRCHGEAFNGAFVGYPNRDDVLGVTRVQRDADPHVLLDAIRNAPGQINGFRYFHDHDPRILTTCLDDPRCAKILLTRNPLDAYVSWKIARATDQWKLTQVRSRKTTKVQFDAEEFTVRTEALRTFHLTILQRLQHNGQTAFYLDYDDLRDVGVINGLARFLGVDGQLDAPDMTLKAQNPEPVSAKVGNPREMEKALVGLDPFALERVPVFEPRRGPAVPSYVAAHKAPLLYLPMPGGSHGQVEGWLAALDGVGTDRLQRGFSRKLLRNWRAAHKPHRVFTVIEHPLARAHSVYCRRILSSGTHAYARLRQGLVQGFDLQLPEDGIGPDWCVEAHRAGFVVFLRFLKANLNGQTAQRVDADWSSQVEILRGLSEVAPPDHVMRYDSLQADLDAVSSVMALPSTPLVEATPREPFALSDIYDDDLEKRAQAAYPRDYLAFGLGAWR